MQHFVSFSSKPKATNVFPKHILKSKSCDKSIKARKKLFCHLVIKNYLCKVLCKFLITIESMWRWKIKERAPELNLLYCSRTVRSSHWRCSIKKVNIAEFLRLSILKNICEWLRFDCFNGSL